MKRGYGPANIVIGPALLIFVAAVLSTIDTIPQGMSTGEYIIILLLLLALALHGIDRLVEGADWIFENWPSKEATV